MRAAKSSPLAAVGIFAIDVVPDAICVEGWCDEPGFLGDLLLGGFGSRGGLDDEGNDCKWEDWMNCYLVNTV